MSDDDTAASLRRGKRCARDRRARLLCEFARPMRCLLARLYIQMEFCEGRTLRDVINNGELGVSHANYNWRLLRQILEARSARAPAQGRL